MSNGKRVVLYDDNDVVVLNLENIEWNYGNPTNAIQSGFGLTVECIEQEILSETLDFIGNRSFFRLETQAFDQSLIVNVYEKNGESFEWMWNVYGGTVYRSQPI